MILDDLFSCGFDIKAIDQLGEILAADTLTLEAAAGELGKSMAATLTAAKVIAKDVFGAELEVAAPRFAESAEGFQAERAQRISAERERNRILRELRAIEEDLALAAWERSQAAAASAAA